MNKGVLIKMFTMPKLAFYVTLRCNLKCKLCAVYAPYYKEPFHPTLEYLNQCIDQYFNIVERVRLFSISGGEPLLRNDLPLIINKIHQYENRIDRLEIITNGTIIPSDELIDSLQQFRIQLNFLVDDYGQDKSVNALAASVKFRKIDGASVTLRDYHSDEMHCGGWVNYGISVDSPQKSIEETKRLFSKCSYPQKLDFCTSMVNGKLYSCTQLRRLIEIGVLDPDPSEVFDLFDPNQSAESIWERIKALYDVDMLSACAYCNGICDDSIRYPAAEQLSH